MDSAEDSVFQHITGLCEKSSIDLYKDSLDKQKVVTNLRSRAFNKLLFFKNVLQNQEEENESDVEFLVADIYLKIHDLKKVNFYYCTKEKTQDVFKVLEKVQNVAEQDSGIASVLRLLLLLADSKVSDDREETPVYGLDLRKYTNVDLTHRSKSLYSVLPDSFELSNPSTGHLYPFIPQYRKSRVFNFTYPFENEPGTGLSNYFSNTYILENRPGPFRTEYSEEEFNSTKWRFPPATLEPQPLSRTSIHVDEGYVTPDKDHLLEIDTSEKVINHWDGRHLQPSSSLRTWEDLGSKEVKREPPFVSKSKTSVFHLWRIIRVTSISDDSALPPTRVIEVTEESLSNDIKFLLIAIESNTFHFSQESNSFVIKHGVYLEGISPDTLEQYCQEYIRCANSYQMLTQLINQDTCSQNKPHESLIFMSLCRCVQRYIQCYHGIILRLPLSQGLTKMNHWVVTLRTQLEFLAELCCVYPTDGPAVLPCGGALLAHIYNKVTEVVRQDLAYLLYYILESCCLVYFRFLEKWIFEGVCEDPYGEFFIEARAVSDISYDRLFWTRGFVLKRLLVPGFLKGLENDLFVCGKSLSLLKLSNVNDPLLWCLKNDYPGVNCCLDQEGLDRVFSKCSEYRDHCEAECGSRPRVFCSLTEEEEEVFKLSLIKQREKTFDKIRKAQEESKKLKTAKKREVFKELKKSMENEEARKIEARQSQLLEEENMLEKAMELEKTENLRKEEERRKMVEYYKTLSAAAEKHRLKVEWKLGRMKLNEVRLQFLKDEHAQLQNEVCTLGGIPRMENLSISSGTGDFVIPNKANQSELKVAIVSESAGDGPGIENVVEHGIAKDVFVQAQINKKRVLQEEFNLLEHKNISVDKDHKAEVVMKQTEREERTQKEWKMLETGIVNADEARLKAAKNRERAYGAKYNIITGEHKRYTELDCNVVEVIKDPIQDLDISEMIIESAVSPEHVDSMEKCNCETSDCELILVQEESSHDVLDIPIVEVVERPKVAVKEVKSIYKEINEFKHPIIVDIADCILPDIETRKQISMEQIDITKIYNCLHKSVLFPLRIQLKLVNDAILRLFINEHNLIAHLDCIRKYFFLLDGDYACNLTKHLFAEMQLVKRPTMLLNHLRLNSLLRTAVGNISEQYLAERLSFLVNKVPNSFHLIDPNALACLSMSYKTHWPVNVIITPQAISKYDRVFTFLMQLRRASWALEQDIYLLKVKLPSKSSQYRQVHLFRHVMAQFLQALQNYVMTTVMEHSWFEMKKELDKASTLEALYASHVSYVKKVIFRCLLNKRSKTIHKHLLDLFRIILTFHENLRSDNWAERSNGEFQHPAFPRLCHQYQQFLVLSRFLFSYLERLVTSGYQPHLEQLLTLLSCNKFYNSTES